MAAARNSASPFAMPNAVKITGRISSVTNSFINALIPVVKPTTDEVLHALDLLGMTEATICCAYCGGPYSEWDHLRPLVEDKMPTGYISEIHNLVPACQKCNQSKGNKPWRTWMFGRATQSPATREVTDLDERAERLDAYEVWQEPTLVDFAAIVGDEVWRVHWDRHAAIVELMREAQVVAEQMRLQIAASYLAMTRSAEVDETDVPQADLNVENMLPAGPRTMYVVTTTEGDSAPLTKRDALLALVTALAASGLSCESLSIVTGRSALRSVNGIAAGELLWDSFADAHGQRLDQRKLWFIDAPIHQDGRTWVLANNRWGRGAENTMTDLVKIGPDVISYRRADESRTITAGVETSWS